MELIHLSLKEGKFDIQTGANSCLLSDSIVLTDIFLHQIYR